MSHPIKQSSRPDMLAEVDGLQEQGGLAKNSVGVLGIVFFVVAAAAPLTVVVALFPVIIASGNGIGIAGAFVMAACVLLLFAVGFVAMSRHITNAGAFYAYITKGLGRPVGLGSASLAIFSYNAIQLGLYGGIGFYAEEYVRTHLGLHAPWWVYSFGAMAATLLLGVRHIHSGARVLAVLLTLETGIIAILDIGILSNGGQAGTGFSMEPFSIKATLSGAVGVALMFAHASFIGFEGTAIYGEEARDAKRTVPRATYISLVFMGVFYAFTAWLVINSLGVGQAVDIAQKESGNLMFRVSGEACGEWVTQLFQLLSITSMFAAIVTFHNNVARYLFSLGRQNIIWSKFSQTHPVSHAPYVSCIAQTLSVAVVVAVFAVLGLNPYDTLFTWFTGIGAVGIIMIQCIASIAVFMFFRITGLDKRVWNTFIAPILGAIGLLSFLYFAFDSLDVLLGVKGFIQLVFVAMLFGSLALGICGALYMKFRHPKRYAELASSLGDQS